MSRSTSTIPNPSPYPRSIPSCSGRSRGSSPSPLRLPPPCDRSASHPARTRSQPSLRNSIAPWTARSPQPLGHKRQLPIAYRILEPSVTDHRCDRREPTPKDRRRPAALNKRRSSRRGPRQYRADTQAGTHPASTLSSAPRRLPDRPRHRWSGRRDRSARPWFPRKEEPALARFPQTPTAALDEREQRVCRQGRDDRYAWPSDSRVIEVAAVPRYGPCRCNT